MLSNIVKNLAGSFIMNIGVVLYARAALLDPRISPLAGSAIRVMCNLLLTLCLFGAARLAGKNLSLWGQNRRYLLVWGFLGSATIICYFNAVESLGVATAGFLLNASGSLIVLFQYFFSAGTVPLWQLASALLCMVGAGLLGLGNSGLEFQMGFHWGLLAALAAGAAYYVMGRKLRQEAVGSTTFYWSLINVFIHGALLEVRPTPMPETSQVLLMLILSGLLAAAGQYWVNASFQTAQSGLMGIVSYLNCVVAIFLDVLILGRSFSAQQYFGAALIVTTSVLTMWFSRRPRLDSGLSTNEFSSVRQS